MKYNKMLIVSTFLLSIVLFASVYLNFKLLDDEENIKSYAEDLSVLALYKSRNTYNSFIKGKDIDSSEFHVNYIMMYNDIAYALANNVVYKDDNMKKILKRSETIKMLLDDISNTKIDKEKFDKIEILYKYVIEELKSEGKNLK